MEGSSRSNIVDLFDEWVTGLNINLVNIAIKPYWSSLPLHIIDMKGNKDRFQSRIKQTSPTHSQTTNRLLISKD